MVRDDGQRTILFDLDSAIQRLNFDVRDHPSTVQLTGVYHNLLRQWARRLITEKPLTGPRPEGSDLTLYAPVSVR